VGRDVLAEVLCLFGRAVDDLRAQRNVRRVDTEAIDAEQLATIQEFRCRRPL